MHSVLWPRVLKPERPPVLKHSTSWGFLHAGAKPFQAPGVEGPTEAATDVLQALHAKARVAAARGVAHLAGYRAGTGGVWSF